MESAVGVYCQSQQNNLTNDTNDVPVLPQFALSTNQGKAHNPPHAVFPIAQLVKRVNRVLNAQKVGKSRLLLLIQSNPPNNEIYIFVKIFHPQKMYFF